MPKAKRTMTGPNTKSHGRAADEEEGEDDETRSNRIASPPRPPDFSAGGRAQDGLRPQTLTFCREIITGGADNKKIAPRRKSMEQIKSQLVSRSLS